MIVMRAVVGSQKGASGAPNWVTSDSLIELSISFFLVYLCFSHASCYSCFILCRVRHFRAQRASSTHDKMCFDIVGLENLFGKSQSIFPAKFFARTNVNIDFAILRPRM